MLTVPALTTCSYIPLPIASFPGLPCYRLCFTSRDCCAFSAHRKKKSGKNKSTSKEKAGAVPPDYDTRSMEGDLEEEEREREGEGGGGRTVHTPDGYDSNEELLATIAKV